MSCSQSSMQQRGASVSDVQESTEIAELESREAELRAAIDSPSDVATGRRPRTIPQAPAVSSHAADGTPGRQDLEIIFSSPRFQPDLLKRLLARENIQQPDVGPAELPSMDLAEFLVMTYMNESHVQKPFLLTDYVANLVQEIYSHTPPEASDAQDLFRLYMICAISAVPLRRRGLEQQHPYSFFLAASAYFDKVNFSSGVEALQNLFLLARFAVYFHIGASTWELGRICIGICIEQEMHLPPLFEIPPLEEQHRRRLFLGELRLGPTQRNEFGEFNVANGSLCLLDFMRLRRITSRVQRAFFASTKAKSSVSQNSPVQHATDFSEVYDKLQKLLDELEEWRHDAPMFTDMTAFYQAQAWYDFLWEKERLLLLRGAMNDISARCGSMPRELSKSCCDCATKVITLYSDMFWPKQNNATRHYFQTLLAAGLLVAYLSSHLGRLDRSITLLQSLSEEMTDARPYATVFELIREMTCSGWKAYKQAAVSSIDEMDALDLSMATNLPDWSYSPGYLFAGVEAYVNHFATGDFATDPMLDPVSWMRGV
ncbi:unnamed protein product [Zymoseptoria tritici ST99CH_1E4]|uniref:Transcription factor domain-containing protein n=1 Tax=Zymoseptoria tritici ST99CH_1E4 TaxID=1276532 RepID=A0A2H1H8V2_ZYMTR|nr:unnamed protein product [Zymoseptoria tritici ST99CH_1E4]